MILVIGATGNVGKELVPLLAKSGVPVRLMLRNPKVAPEWEGRVELVRGDLNQLDTLHVALRGVRKVYLIAFDARQVENLIVAAKAAGVTHIVRQSTQEAGVVPPVGPGKWHRAQERLIEQSGLEWTHLRPTMMAVNTIMWWSKTIRMEGKVHFPGGAGLVAPIDPTDIASVALVTLTRPGHERRAYELTGPELLSVAEMVQVLARVLEKPIEYVDVPEPATAEWLGQFGFAPYLADALTETLGNLRSSRFAYVSDAVERLTGRQPRRFEDWCRANRASFLHTGATPESLVSHTSSPFDGSHERRAP
jgi:uncharacterized protein YbjT (DUF2867 family)